MIPTVHEDCMSQPIITDIWETKINPLEHSYFGSATRADHSQINSRMIVDNIKNDNQRSKDLVK
jgi:hypothetical protein